jgi:hypothetical protein
MKSTPEVSQQVPLKEQHIVQGLLKLKKKDLKLFQISPLFWLPVLVLFITKLGSNQPIKRHLFVPGSCLTNNFFNCLLSILMIAIPKPTLTDVK